MLQRTLALPYRQVFVMPAMPETSSRVTVATLRAAFQAEGVCMAQMLSIVPMDGRYALRRIAGWAKNVEL